MEPLKEYEVTLKIRVIESSSKQNALDYVCVHFDGADFLYVLEAKAVEKDGFIEDEEEWNEMYMQHLHYVSG